MKQVRRVHMWLGVFFAPAILFFACSGGLMTLGFHKGSFDGEASGWVAKMAQIHRKQGAAPLPPRVAKLSSDKPSTDAPSSLLFRVFAVSMAAGLGVTTLLGIWMAFASLRNRRLVWALLLLGIGHPSG